MGGGSPRANFGGAAQLYPCRALVRAFAQPGWRNDYMAARANESLKLCADLSGGSATVQAQAARVLSDGQGLPLVRVRAPLALVLASRWCRRVWGSHDRRYVRVGAIPAWRVTFTCLNR